MNHQPEYVKTFVNVIVQYNGSPVKTTKRKNIVNHSVSGHRIDFAADGRA